MFFFFFFFQSGNFDQAVLFHRSQYRVNINNLPTLFKFPTSNSEETSNLYTCVPSVWLRFPTLTCQQLFFLHPLLFWARHWAAQSVEAAAWMFKFQWDLTDRVLFLNKYILKKRGKTGSGKKKSISLCIFPWYLYVGHRVSVLFFMH